MSEPQEFGTESAPGAADAPAREFTPEELAQARAQLLAQGEDLSNAQGPPVDPESLGAHAVGAGAEAAAVDPNELLAAIRGLQSKVDALEAEKRQANAPDVVKYTQALHDHLAGKAAAHPVIQANPDHSWGQAPDAQGANARGVLASTHALVADAQGAADSGKVGHLAEDVGKVEDWVKRHARRFPQIDYSYILDLAAEAAGAVAKLAA